MYKGQMYTVVFDEKPTQKEALQAISEKLDSVPPASTIPTSGEVKLILEKATGTKYYIPLLLACYGLRRSEILALELSDLSDNNILTINKAMVVGSDKQ